MSNKAVILERLRALGVPFDLYEHAPAYTMEECLALPFAQEDVTICKNMLLCNARETWLYLSLAGKRFRTSTVSRLIGTSRLQFAPESYAKPRAARSPRSDSGLTPRTASALMWTTR